MAAKKRQTEEQQEEATPERLDRTEAANEVIAEMEDETTLEALAEKADALYVERSGGKAKRNIDAATYEVWRSLQTLEAHGLVETEEADTIVRKVKK